MILYYSNSTISQDVTLRISADGVGKKGPHPAFGQLIPSCGREKAITVWAFARNSEALKGIVEALFAMLGLVGSATVARIPLPMAIAPPAQTGNYEEKTLLITGS